MKLQMKIKELEVERNAIYEDYQDLGKEKYLLEEKLEKLNVNVTLDVKEVVEEKFKPITRKLEAMEVINQLMNRTMLVNRDIERNTYILMDYDGNEVELDPEVYKNVVDFIERGMM